VQDAPIKAYLERHGKVVRLRLPWDHQSSTITSSAASAGLSAQPMNEIYTMIAGDLNPINLYFAFASLPDTITHAIWSRAATRKIPQGDSTRVLA
jgi:hypothetical protein